MRIRIITIIAAAGIALTGCTADFTLTYDDGGYDDSATTTTDSWDEPAPQERGPVIGTDSTSTERLARTAFDETVAVMEAWDPDFRAPRLELYSGTIYACGEQLDPGNAYYCDGAVYLDTDYLADAESNSPQGGELNGVVAHEVGHAWAAQNVRTSDEIESENYADCIAGAVAAGAGWDIGVIADYAYTIGDYGPGRTHGTSEERYNATIGGAENGHQYCASEL